MRGLQLDLPGGASVVAPFQNYAYYAYHMHSINRRVDLCHSCSQTNSYWSTTGVFRNVMYNIRVFIDCCGFRQAI